MPSARSYFVYILTNRTRTLYVGVTKNLPRSIYKHRSDEIPAFTSKYKIHRLVYFEDFVDIREAIARNQGWLRSRKIELIDSINPKWRGPQLGVVAESAPEESLRVDPSLRSG